MINNIEVAALYGGSFDPPHLGHRAIIESILLRTHIDRIIVTPAWLNPFKEHSHAKPKQRLRWCKEVFDLKGVIISDYEIRQEHSVYTIETWNALKGKYPLKYLIIGADNLAHIQEWREFESLDSQVVWIVVTRGESEPDLSRLHEAILLPLKLPVSSTQIRNGEKLDFVDSRIREEVIRIYHLNRKEA